MNFQRACTHVLYIPVILACLGDFKHIIKAEEYCYRGDGLLDYKNPCFGDSPEEPEEYDLCPKGQRLTKRCTQDCRYCEPGTYQNTHTNCTSCLNCTTDCRPGQVIQNCTAESDTVCGCPSSPPCPACPTCSACPSCPNVTCPSVTACPSVTPCPAQPECLKDVADPLVDNNFASCQHCCIPLIVVLVIAFVAAAGAFVGYFMYCKPRFKRLRDANSKDNPEQEQLVKVNPDQRKNTTPSTSEADGASLSTNNKNGVHESQELKSKLQELEEKLQACKHQLEEKDGEVKKQKEDLQKKDTKVQELKKQLEGMQTIERLEESTTQKDPMIITFLYLKNSLSSGNWRDFGRQLGILEPKLSSIQGEHQHDIEEAIYQILESWKQKKGPEATYKALIAALEKAGRADLAWKVQTRMEFVTKGSN